MHTPWTTHPQNSTARQVALYRHLESLTFVEACELVNYDGPWVDMEIIRGFLLEKAEELSGLEFDYSLAIKYLRVCTDNPIIAQIAEKIIVEWMTCLITKQKVIDFEPFYNYLSWFPSLEAPRYLMALRMARAKAEKSS